MTGNIGVFIGSALWWLTLSFGMGMMQERVSPNLRLWIDRFSGTVIMAFGMIASLSLK